ncbi:FAD-dependent monooxygenase [Mycolicibacterium brisbanense]|uniref:2-polyprenyl-6-methoxyphenol hydroxylase-like oxidoreductase n=1 Tax=Mycolicibacterium brisbanense TaxID=146020 RepID=A0A100W427_9MYCO|nr:FAD-dependent monooxygenase [Mycolicibacterium brisbanense]MCV7157186.1 FAD-dependent monooxygenase [Mycolicibacterium brisbanense]GAS91253.1 2-polyprenyl-6-methoxyphenol hydroxylase-like oxidoreductase [Mycolicibacterium brisbanense]
MTTTTTTDVLIVGAGPAGTTLAIDLARRGVTVRLIDKAPHAFDGSRAKGIQPRTLEVLDDLGALGDIINQGALYPPMGIHLGPITIPFRMMEKGKRGPDVPYPDTWLIPQHRTDRALRARFESLGGRVEFGTELMEFTDHDTHVTAHVATSGGAEDITARYLVGADGGASRVRRALGIEFGGSTDEADRILIVDAAVSGGLSRKYWHVWPGLKGRFVGACPLPHSDKFQWMIRLSPDEAAPQELAQINARIHAHTRNKRLALHDIAWQSVFRPNIRLAANYRRGRVLLAGDAAHVHTPAGAQGLNTGIGDAYNLGWKLGQVLAGADDQLLDTYEHERQPIAASVLGLSTKKYEGIGKFDPSSIRRGKDEKQLALTYHGGPLAPLAADRTKTLQVGDRAPNADLVDADGHRVRLFDSYRGAHFTALAYGAHAAGALAELDWPAAGAQLTRVIVDTSNKGDLPDGVLTDPTREFARIYGLSRDTLLLIRPDGYIAHIAIHNIAETTRTAVQFVTPHSVRSAPSKRS